ncbi:MAG: hypothetical protein DK303_001174 [Chloroflexi bacterium]|jgi:hypothetical protein|nr:MAG: hypothetical protein DK303_001174 [Chloroflexota bacterium]
MLGFHLDYYLCCVIAVSGLLFIATSNRNSSAAVIPYCLGIILMLTAAILFFSTDNRIINDYQGGLDANEQTGLFALSTLTALIIRKLFSVGKKIIRTNSN